jgi:hypothetical protein
MVACCNSVGEFAKTYPRVVAASGDRSAVGVAEQLSIAGVGRSQGKLDSKIEA